MNGSEMIRMKWQSEIICKQTVQPQSSTSSKRAVERQHNESWNYETFTMQTIKLYTRENVVPFESFCQRQPTALVFTSFYSHEYIKLNTVVQVY